MPVLLLFFCSGATALVYEVVWSRYLALMFGSTVQAQTVVLAVFMGGLALGNRLFGARADRAANPLALYGGLEVAIGLYAYVFSYLFAAADRVFVAAGTGRLDQPFVLLTLKAVLSLALLLGPTILMGGTLPILAAWLQRRSGEAGRASARFYSVNSLGAVAGSWLAGFVLVRAIGLEPTLQITGLVNAVIGFIALGIAKHQAHEPAVRPTAAPATPPAGPAPAAPANPLFLACLMVSLTGAVAMGLEVLAARSLALVFGASLQAFAVVLMAFILGIGAGGTVIASPRFRALDGRATASFLLVAAALWVGVLVASIEDWVEVYRHLRTGLAASDMGYRYQQAVSALLAMGVLGLPAALIGAVLPLWIRVIGGQTGHLGHHVGRLLTWNTLGAVVGSLVTGFLLMPALGLRASFGFLALVLAAAGAAGAWQSGNRRLAGAAGAVITGLLLVLAIGGEGWRHVFSSGVFRRRETTVDTSWMERRKKHVIIPFYEDAPDATVSVEEGPSAAGLKSFTLRINGKPDASSVGDLATQLLLAHLPMMARPDAKDVFVLGFGSGMTAGALLGHPVEKVVVAENCEPVLRAAKFFEPWSRGVLKDPRVRFEREDGRTALKLSPQAYDVIISEPSNPWMAGVGSVFSREFYALCASRLKPGGIMCQWFHVYEMNDRIVGMVLRTFQQVFPHMEIWDVDSGDIVLLGAAQPWKSGPDVFRAVFARTGPAQDLMSIGLSSPEGVLARQLASQRTAFAMGGFGPVQTDGFPMLEYEAPRAFYIGDGSTLVRRFDERTWQMELATPEKQGTLSSLPKEELRSTFAHYRSSNLHLNSSIDWHLADNPDAGAPPDIQAMPVIFWPDDTRPWRLRVPANASPDHRRLVEAVRAIHLQPESWREAVDTIEQVLRTYDPKNSEMAASWVPAEFAAHAARTCLGHRDYPRAYKVLETGLKIDPGAPELHYLARLLDREMPPSATNAPSLNLGR